MTAQLLVMLSLGASPDLTQVTDHLFHHSDVRAAAKAADQIVAAHPDDADALELAMIAHAAIGDSAGVNRLAVQRAARGDARALPALLFAWQDAHTPPSAAEPLLLAGRKLLPALDDAEAAPLHLMLAHLDRILGRFDASVADARLPGQITDWQMIGPFDNDQDVGFATVYPPETAVDLSATYPGKAGDVRWRPVLGTLYDGAVCLECAQYPNVSVVSYLVSWVQSPAETDVAFWAHADDRIKLWVNGRLAATDDTARVALSARADEDRGRPLPALSEAMDMDPGFAAAATHKAQIHEAMGLYEAAETEAQKAAAGNPEASDALALLAQLRLRRKFWVEAARLSAKAEAALPG